MSVSDNDEPIFPGESPIRQLLNQLPQEKREFVIQLLAELGLLNDPASMPIFIALQYYVNLIESVPQGMRSAADEALRNFLVSVGTVQTNIDNSIDRLQQIVENSATNHQEKLVEASKTVEQTFIDLVSIAAQGHIKWKEDLQGVLKEAEKVAVNNYKAATAKIDEKRQAERAQERRLFDQEIRRESFWRSMGSTVVAILAVGGVCWWGSGVVTQQRIYKEFGGEAPYDELRNFAKKGDNPDRLARCRADSNPKCTFWLVDPKSLPPDQRQ